MRKWRPKASSSPSACRGKSSFFSSSSVSFLPWLAEMISFSAADFCRTPTDNNRCEINIGHREKLVGEQLAAVANNMPKRLPDLVAAAPAVGARREAGRQRERQRQQRDKREERRKFHQVVRFFAGGNEHASSRKCPSTPLHKVSPARTPA